MSATIPNPVYPDAARLLAISREATWGTPSTGTYYEIPVAGFSPDPKVTMVEDKGLRGSMTSIYDLIPTTSWLEATIPESPLYGDTIGHVLVNLFGGDWADTGTASTPTWTTSAALAVGAVNIPVTSASSAVAGTYIQVGSAAGTTEVVTAGTGSTATNIVLSAATPLRLSHLTGISITTVVAPFVHSFAVQNPASLTGSVSGQPPSHTIVDRNQTAGSGGYYADVYPYCCFSQVELAGTATGLLTWSGSLTGWPQQAATALVAPSLSAVRGVPAWKGTSTIGGNPLSNVADWKITLSREVEPLPAIDGQQNPFVIARGALDGVFAITYSPAVDQTALSYLLQTTPVPTLDWATSNGLSGASLVSLSVQAQLGTYQTVKLAPKKTLFGYDITGRLASNTTNINGSGGWGPVTVVLTNGIPSY
jgi:hypothetical protein